MAPAPPGPRTLSAPENVLAPTNPLCGSQPFPFMRLPAELRIRVYRHLFPDKEIPSNRRKPRRGTRKSDSSNRRPGSSKDLRIDGQGCFAAILRISRAVYEEASSVLYGSVPFAVNLTHDEISYCMGSYLGELDLTTGRRDLFEKVRCWNLSIRVPPRAERDLSSNGPPTDELLRSIFEPYEIRHRLRSFVKGIGTGKRVQALTVSLIREYDYCSEELVSVEDVIWYLEPLRAVRGVREAELACDDWDSDSGPKFVIFKRTLESLMMSNNPVPEEDHRFDTVSELHAFVRRMSSENTAADRMALAMHKSLYYALVAHDKRDVNGFLWYQAWIANTWRRELERRRLQEEKTQDFFDVLPATPPDSVPYIAPKWVRMQLALSDEEEENIEYEMRYSPDE